MGEFISSVSRRDIEIKISDLWQIQAVFQRWNTPTGAKNHSWHLPFKAGKPLSVICFLENFSGWHITKYPHSVGLIFFTFAADKGKASQKLTQEKRIFSTWIATYLCIIACSEVWITTKCLFKHTEPWAQLPAFPQPSLHDTEIS